MKGLLKSLTYFYKQGALPSVLLFASPRGGSTWITELIASQPRFWPISEPLNLRSVWVRKHLKLNSFKELYGDSATQKIYEYYQKILAGGYADLRLRPGLPFYRLFTNRIVVKENQGCLDRMGWFEDSFGVKIIHLIRHPIPVALSREVFPLLDEFAECALRSQFSTEELLLADRIIASGSHLEKGVLAWCLHHLPALRAERESWLRISYEETVLQPENVIDRLVNTLSLSDSDRMKRQIVEPSQVTRKSNAETRKLLTGKQNREFLIHKWKRRVSDADLQRVDAILQTFDAKIYSAFSPTPLSRPLSND